jgi:hypothetical protein
MQTRVWIKYCFYNKNRKDRICQQRHCVVDVHDLIGSVKHTTPNEKELMTRRVEETHLLPQLVLFCITKNSYSLFKTLLH